MSTNAFIGGLLIPWYTRVNDTTVRWHKVVLWWELRRIPYNILVIAFGIGLLYLQGIFIKGGGGGSPIVLIMIFLGKLLLVNFFYTLGWITDLILQRVEGLVTSRLRSRLFLYVLFTTLIVQFLLNLAITINAVNRGWVQMH